MKPRIKLTSRAGMPKWKCTHCHAAGYGDTPSKAYAELFRRIRAQFAADVDPYRRTQQGLWLRDWLP